MFMKDFSKFIFRRISEHDRIFSELQSSAGDSDETLSVPL